MYADNRIAVMSGKEKIKAPQAELTAVCVNPSSITAPAYEPSGDAKKQQRLR